jgi:deazaflavin-dependent oxidoreductase (nitroreductase family)
VTGIPADELEVTVTVTGRSSGARRRVRLWFVVLDGRVYVMAGEPQRSHWLRNVRTHPDVEIEIAGHIWQATARAANGGPEDAAVRSAFGEKYGTTYLARWLRESFVVAIDLGPPL